MIAQPTIDPEIQEKLTEEGLRYYTDASPGFFRQKFGKEFEYYDLEGKKIRDKAVLERIKALGIPPAWKKVWISPKKNSHLQATGIDDRGRKQYIYHPDWVRACQEDKFSKLVDFGLSLPKIRSRIRYDMGQKGLDKQKLLATIIWLLEHTFIRVGNDEYAKQNNSFGLTTLRNKHVSVRGSDIVFRFRGKSGINHLLEISHPGVAKTIKKCIELPGFELFQYIDEEGNRHVVDSADVNSFLKDVTSDDFSAKDFRTWGATHLSAKDFHTKGMFTTDKEFKRQVLENAKTVSSHLGNTVSVCRSYYIHPSVVSSHKEKILIPHFDLYKKRNLKKAGLTWDEYALITLLQKSSHTS